MGNSRALGRQIIAEFYECAPVVLNDPERIKFLMNRAASEAKATIVESCFHAFSPHGVSGVVVIAESHFAIHTWPEHGYAAVDLFTCGETLDAWKGLEVLKSGFEAARYSVMEVNRGLIGPNARVIENVVDTGPPILLSIGNKV